MDIKKIKQLISIVEHANISHLSLEHDNQKIEIRKELAAAPGQVFVQQHSVPQMAAPVATAQPQAAAAPAVAVKDPNLIAVKAQMVGTFYGSPNPESPFYVTVGDSIKQGQVICIIEAMKLFNEIESDISGVVEKVCLESGTPVEYGQELFLVRV